MRPRADAPSPRVPPRARRSPGERASPRNEAGALKLWVVLSRAQAAVARHAEADIARHGLTLAEFAILEALFHKGPLLLGELQRKILVSSGGITYLVDRLAERALVERQDCPEDRRARYVALTRKGDAFIRRIFPVHARSIARAVSGLTPAEQGKASALLKSLGHAAAAAPVAPGEE
jgi:MarR family 2-MHQ and catechol resistance regulon transcriptional repressor